VADDVVAEGPPTTERIEGTPDISR
jgi:hypothetical protein